MESNTFQTEAIPVERSKLRSCSIPRPQKKLGGQRLSASMGSISTLIDPKLDHFIRSADDSFIDAIKSSPPNQIKLIKDHGVHLISSPNQFDYQSWMEKYPSALVCFEKIMDYAKEKKVVMFLDYDGTLSPIVEDPDRAFMSDDMRSAVKRVAKYFPTTIISGRSRDKVYELVGLTELYYAGSHGMDIMFPVRDSTDHSNCFKSTNSQGEEVSLFQPAREFLSMIDEIYKTLVENTKNINGAKVENHKFCASVHYRNVDEKSWPLVAQCVHDTLKDYPRLRLTHGRKVLEVRPLIDWDKGKAVEFLLESLRIDNSDNVLPIYIGDDRTDEDAFKFLRERNRGYGILVSSSAKESQAVFSLQDPSEVNEFLNSLVRWKEEDALKVPKKEHKAARCPSCTLYRYSVIFGIVIAVMLVLKKFTK